MTQLHSYSEDEGEVFLGRSVNQQKSMSDETVHQIDKEIRDFIDRNYQRAETILKENMDVLHAMAKALMKYETIDASQIASIMKGEEPTPPEGWSDDGDGPAGTPPSPKKPKSSGSDDVLVGDPA